MLTKSNFLLVQGSVMSNVASFLPQMMGFKSSIQREVLDIMTNQELCDVRDSRLNLSVVNKLADLGGKHFRNSDQSDNTLYCVCMAIGTIIKEYEWGTDYLKQDGMCRLAAMISK